MSRPKIVVTGATGKTGGALTRELLERGYPVRAVVRRHDDRSRHLQRQGAEVVVADVFDPDQLIAALAGTQRAYYVPVFHPHMLTGSLVFGLAAREAGLESVVQLSQWLSHRAHPAAMTRQTWLTDQALPRLTGVAHTVINPGLFADNFLRTIDFAALLGIHPVLTGAGRAAPVTNEDIARVVVAALLDPARHDGRTYRPTGPELLSGRDMGEIIGRVVGHRVRSVDLPFRMFLKVARQQRVDPFEIASFRHYVEEMRRGTFALDGGVTDVVETLTGRPAETFETAARRYAALPFARQTIANRIRAAAFAVVPLYPAYDLPRYERQLRLPEPPSPSLAVDDERWRDEHHRQMAGRVTADGTTQP